MTINTEVKDAFSCWEYNPNNFTLVYNRPNVGYAYEIDLEDCYSSASVLDWIVQVSNKTWMPTEDLGRLVKALDILLNLQKNLCSFAMRFDGKIKEKKIKDQAHLAKIIQENLFS